MPEYIPIPGWPGYFINSAGNVRSQFGPISMDAKNRFRLRDAKTGKICLMAMEKLMELAGSVEKGDSSAKPVGNDPENDAFSHMRVENEKLLADLDRAKNEISSLNALLVEARRLHGFNRRLNATLWARLRRLESEFEKSAMPDSKKSCLIEREIQDWEKDGYGLIKEIDL